MLTIPLKVGVSKDQAEREITDFLNGVKDNLDDIIGKGGLTIDVEAKFSASGAKEVTAAYTKLNTESKQYENALNKQVKTQAGSITSLRQSVNTLKQQRDALNQTNPAWQDYANKVKNAQAQLRAAQGIQVGSLADLRRQRDELLKLRDATARFPSGPPTGGPTWNDLNYQIKALDGQIRKTSTGFSQFFTVLGKIATVQAGFIAVTSAIGAITGVVNAYVGRTKQIESFNLALKNVGLTQAETTTAFREATAIATRLGAPLQQVEKSYQRMVPALRAVGASTQETDSFIENITARTQTLGLNTEQSGRLLEAFAQVLSKGKLQAEELNQQISELDGAFRTQLADALGVTTAELTKLVEKGAVTAPVFVKAVNSMSNGVEELQKRIENGTATIQQLQNGINNINVAILAEIGRQIEPGIRAFLQLSVNVAKFFQEFSKTEIFKSFAIIFNQTAKGLEVFISSLLKVIQVVGSILEPFSALLNSVLGLGEGFGGLIGILVNVGGAILVLKGIKIFAGLLTDAKKKAAEFTAELLKLGGAKNYLDGELGTGSLPKFRQRLENVRAGLTGLGKKLKDSVGSFLGFKKNIEGAASGAQEGAVQLELLSYNTQKVAPAATKAATGLKSVKLATPGLNATTTVSQRLTAAVARMGVAVQAAGGKLRQLGAAGLAAAKGLGSTLGSVLGQLLNPATIIIGVIGGVIQGFQEAGQEAESIKGSFSGAFEALAKEVTIAEDSLDSLGVSFKEANSNLQKSADAARNSAVSWGLLTAGILALGISIATAGVGAPAAFLALGATAAASAATVNQLNNELKKSAGGRALIDTSERFSEAIDKQEAKLRRLGVTAGQVDFSNITDSKELGKITNEYKKLDEGLSEYITNVKRLIQEEKAKQKPDQARIAFLTAEALKYRDKAKAIGLSTNAASKNTAALIALGDEGARAAADIEELARAQSLFENAIDVGVIEAQTEAIKKYGGAAGSAGQLAAAKLAIDKGASEKTLKFYQDQITSLKKIETEDAKQAEKRDKQLEDATKKVAEETRRQVEIQKELENAIVDAFEKGVQGAQKIGDTIGQSVEKAKQAFDGISSGVSSGLGAALSLVDAVANTELQGLEKGDARRKQIIREQIKAAALVNQVENEIAQIKLAVQNRIAQNEARIAQLRYQTEAKIAAARGDFDLAGALSDAAKQQDSIIQGLQTQYQLESKALDIQKQVKDQQLIQKGLQEQLATGILAGVSPAEEVARQFGLQNVSLGDAIKGLRKMAAEGRGLVGNFGQAATKLSDLEVSANQTQEAAGDIEVAKIREGFANARVEVDSLNDSLSKTKDPVFEALDASIKLQRSLGEVKRILDSAPGASVPNVPNARAMGGPVAAGSQYLVNDGGGREGFMNKFGNFSMLPAGRNINWTASTSGTIIPAHLVDQYRNASEYNKKIQQINSSVGANSSGANRMSSGVDSGNLIQRVASAMSSSGNTQRITNNVTIQSQEPVTDASKIMTNVARMKLRNSRRI